MQSDFGLFWVCWPPVARLGLAWAQDLAIVRPPGPGPGQAPGWGANKWQEKNGKIIKTRAILMFLGCDRPLQALGGLGSRDLGLAWADGTNFQSPGLGWRRRKGQAGREI